MATSPMTDPKVVSKLIKAATKGISFAFALDKKVLAADKTASADKVAQALKAETGSTKIISGELTLTGKVVAFDVKRGSAGSAEKLLDEWLRKNGLNGYDGVLGGADDVDTSDSDGAEEEESDNRMYQPAFIRRCIKMAREKPMQFGFGIGEDADILGVHPRRKGKQIAALIKRETGAVKMAFGTLTVEGRLLKFTCEKLPLPGLKKRIVRIFKGWKLIVPVKIYGPDGEFIEEGDDALDAELNAGGGTDLDADEPDSDEGREEEAEDTAGGTDSDTRSDQTDGGATTATATPTDIAAAWREARATYLDATDEINAQISALQAALKRSDDEELEAIAEFGLNGVTGNFRVPMMAAMRDLEGARGADVKKAATKLLDAIGKFRAHIDGSEEIEAVDDNPFGVKVSIRKTLGGALADMESVLKKVA
ncbi:hypothetical protein [Caenispirillum bisanense]|uniref:hypothetical protein n=1 Tax=Caenispirillum bisanense TaxID=414052 RepID=UPI0031DA1C54